MNKVFFCGRLTRAPEVKYTANGKAYMRCSIAVPRPYNRNSDAPDADFFNLVAWDKTAEIFGKYLNKGSKIIVEGRLQNNNYEKDGVKHFAVDVIVERMEFADAKQSNQVNDSDGFSGSAIDVDNLPF